jgi:hypothetical protein
MLLNEENLVSLIDVLNDIDDVYQENIVNLMIESYQLICFSRKYHTEFNLDSVTSII